MFSFTIITSVLLLVANIGLILFAYFKYLKYLEPIKGYIYSISLLIVLILIDYRVVSSPFKKGETFEENYLSFNSAFTPKKELSTSSFNTVQAKASDKDIQFTATSSTIALPTVEHSKVVSTEEESTLKKNKVFTREDLLESLTKLSDVNTTTSDKAQVKSDLLKNFTDSSLEILISEKVKVGTGANILEMKSKPLSVPIEKYLETLVSLQLGDNIDIGKIQYNVDGKINYLELIEQRDI